MKSSNPFRTFLQAAALFAAATSFISCAKLQPSVVNTTSKVQNVDLSCANYYHVADHPREWTLRYHNELFPGTKKVTPENIASLASLKVKGLNLTGCHLERTALAEIGNLATLEGLCLAGATWESGNIRSFAGLPLRKLDLSGTSVSDEDLRSIAKMKSLTVLKLNQTTVSDAGLQQLWSSKSLVRLEICGTNATAKGVDAFNVEKPQVTVMSQYDAASRGGVY